MRKPLILVFLVLALGYVNYLAFASERQIDAARTVLVELAPVDPRSLLQGDFMRLGYEIENELRELERNGPSSGQIVLELDDNDVGRYVGEIGVDFEVADIRPNQIAVNFNRAGSWSTTIAPDSFFFQEGTGPIYEEAEYGELRVTADGRVFLTALRDAQFRTLGP